MDGSGTKHEVGGIEMSDDTLVAWSEPAQILNLARWAPSGDNGQPWRFEIVDSSRVRVHLERDIGHVYDRSGTFVLLSGGFLLETIRLAASRFRRRMRYRVGHDDGRTLTVNVELHRDPSVSSEPLSDFIRVRSVCRRRFRTTPLNDHQRAALEAALGNELEIRWMRALGERWRMARLNARSTDIRLRLRETFEVHRRIIDFSCTRSPSGIPAKAIGLDPLTLRTMRWALRSPRRMERVNRIAGTGMPQIEMDLVPGLACGAHLLVSWKRPPSPDDASALLRAGMALQRFWLEATRLGLVMQPGFAPIAFARDARSGAAFKGDDQLSRSARTLASELESMRPGRDLGTLVFAGRIGAPRKRLAASRSVRKPLAELMIASRSAVRRQPGPLAQAQTTITNAFGTL